MIKTKLNEVIVVKIGGSTFGKHEPSVLDVGDVEDIVELQRRGIPLVIVHGGGKMITEWLKKQAITTHFVRGERVTDRPTLEVVISVLAGLANKEIVTLLNSREGKAVGISGVDGALLEGKLREKEMGFVGTVTRVNTSILDTLLNSGFIPVIAPLSIHVPGGTDGEPLILNVNGDTVAGEIAAAIAAERLIFLTDVDGIHDKQDNLISHLSPAEAEELLSSGVASGGMIPKIKACLKALSRSRTASIIGGKTPHALLREIEGEEIGTTIRTSRG
ncbi:MAG: acetylglutamate kinase [Dehalococcoidales bacterium]|nr:acetylglutamate kinase [Dehalococcoidales bacterium]